MISETGSSETASLFRSPLPFVAALLLLAIIFGGGGAEGPTPNGLLEAFAALILVAVAAGHFAARPLPAQAGVPLWLLAAALAVLAAQVTPLPPALWTALPGRETALAVSRAVGDAPLWRPLSLDPEATRRAAAALLVPAAILLGAAAATRRERLILVKVAVTGAFLSALVGAIQIALGTPDWLSFYGPMEVAVATGFFANANHQAQLLLAAIVLTGLLIRLEPAQIRIRRGQRDLRLHLGWLLFPVFMVMVVTTQSRAGLVLLLPATAAAVIIALNQKRLAQILIVLLGVVTLALAAFWFAPGSAARTMAIQSASFQDGRVISMPDMLYTLRQYWPAGSGLGTFKAVFQANEDLDLVLGPRVNHAHNDLLELLIEGGLPMALLMAAAALAAIVRLRSVLRFRRSVDPAPALAGFAILMLMLFHSLFDYPLRMRAVAAVAALALWLFVGEWPSAEATADPKRRRRKGFARGGLASGADRAQEARPW